VQGVTASFAFRSRRHLDRYSGNGLFQPLRNPDLDYGLTGYAESLGFSVQGLDHPFREIDVDTLLFQPGTSGFGKIQVSRHVFTPIKFPIKVFSFHTG
jgi:hypothetical protein